MVMEQVWRNHSDAMQAQMQRELESFRADERAHHEQALRAVASEHSKTAERVARGETALESLRRTAENVATQSDTVVADMRRLAVRVDAAERSSASAEHFY